MAEQLHPLKLCSVGLQYPDGALRSAACAITPGEIGPAGERQRRQIGSFLEWLRQTPLPDAQREYVETFDFARQSSLHLTYHVHGDRRQRGLELLRIKQAYSAAGFEVEGAELPDFLPLMLEFAALAPGREGIELLDRHRVSLELVRSTLAQRRSPFAALLECAVAALPGLSRRQLARIRRLAAEGPPSEEVGLEPFAPPEVMPSDGAGLPLSAVGRRP